MLRHADGVHQVDQPLGGFGQVVALLAVRVVAVAQGPVRERVRKRFARWGLFCPHIPVGAQVPPVVALHAHVRREQEVLVIKSRLTKVPGLQTSAHTSERMPVSMHADCAEKTHQAAAAAARTHCTGSGGTPSIVRDANALSDTSGVRAQLPSGEGTMRLATQSALKSARAHGGVRSGGCAYSKRTRQQHERAHQRMRSGWPGCGACTAQSSGSAPCTPRPLRWIRRSDQAHSRLFAGVRTLAC
jgi:hypothetical protein